MRPAMISILPHTHAFRCSHPGPASVYLASQPTVTEPVNTARISYLGCTLRTSRLNDDCRPHPTTVAAAPHYPHTRPLDVLARLVYQRILVNTYRTSDLCRPPGRARPPSAYRQWPFLLCRESVLFIGTQFSNLYTAVDTPARGRVICCFCTALGGLQIP